MARGYKNLEKQTAERFVNYNGERVYRSGDYSRWDSDGNVMILGRLDNQVKLRGLRIELDEIIGLIEAQPHIKKAAVVIRKINDQENLCAYFTADVPIDIDALRAELKKHLTHYMVPAAYLQMAEMPMTPNGKTDLKRLPDPVPVSLGEFAEPANAGRVVQLPFTAHYTTQLLARLGFFWNASNERYVDDFISVLGGFSFFDSDNLSR